MLIAIIKRARKIYKKDNSTFSSPALSVFLKEQIGIEKFAEDSTVLEAFLQLDDYDIWGAIKMWVHHEDPILSKLCSMLLNRQLFRITISNEAPSKEEINEDKAKIQSHFKLDSKDVKYFYSSGQLSNNAYMASDKEILILSKNGTVRGVTEAADLPNIKAMSKIVRKYYRCWPKDISL